MVAETRYLPYGEERWTDDTSQPTDFTFTGQRAEREFGLYDYNARYYSPVLGRFVSPDSIVPEPGSSGGFNRYRYARNNPLKYVDPSGHCEEFGDDTCWTEYDKIKNECPECETIVTGDGIVPLHEANYDRLQRYREDHIADPAVYPDLSLSEPDAAMWGWSGSAAVGTGGSGTSVTFGMEELVNFNNAERTTFAYDGHGGAIGASANASAYLGLVWNLAENRNYQGAFESINLTAAVGDLGLSATYFWAPDSGDTPLVNTFTNKGNTKGFAFGYAPGAGVSVSYNMTEYTKTSSSLDVVPETNAR